MSKLIVICGPTSTGKTSLAIKLCKKYNGEIVSADSRQVFKYMDIGTGKKPAISRMKGTVPFNTVGGVYIHLYDVVEPDRKFSVARFKDAATKEIESICRRQKTPFLVGGTGFYIAAVLEETQISRVKPDWQLRRDLEKLPAEELFEKLQKLDPERAKTVDPKNPRRLVRAIEVAAADSSEPRSDGGIRARLFPSSAEVLKIGLTAPREILYHRADAWTERIVNNGLLEEVQDLINRGYRDAEPLKGIIYQTVVDHLDGKVTKEEMLQKIKFDLHGYIRRQLTWFRRDKEIRWFDLTESDFEKKVEKMVKSYLK